MKKIKLRHLGVMAILMLFAVFCQGQIKIGIGTTKVGFIYSPGITWTENQKQDSVIDIFIEGDTMTAIRKLLIYCLQEKSENDNANILLLMINLDALKKMFNSKEFSFYLSEYRNVKTKNKKAREKHNTYRPIFNN
jgi:hypothetical protein